jgi:putative mRNA 3-end processing factor
VIFSRLNSAQITVESREYHKPLTINGVTVTFIPAGHIPGSAQIAVERDGQRWIVTGDYKLENDGISDPFEPVPCDVFISESTFGLPVFKWPKQEDVFREIKAWWDTNRMNGRSSLLLVYSLGKAQRVLHALAEHGPLLGHGAVVHLSEVLRHAGLSIPNIGKALVATERSHYTDSLILAPPSVFGSAWCKRLGTYEAASASGWMAMRGTRRRRGVAKGFVLSDHADWPGLLQAVKTSQASRVLLTHGYTAILARYFREQGMHAEELETLYQGDEE